ncbi:pyridoxamine 5'-phosphate oxidase family protein [Micromonospora sp. NBC_01813]|uniref:pyridoxamine 5'-phosphate oxidase family protein n=1 Tax=Micromonospora sp. NBC_01813 TaxID=2975988 RepID=UPI002DDC731E|nr:pyridoxamine 5'-phosphate oxidase family protein [Micromonospora sp. NBC_01813]WSA09464.1 pyridoxamine 5'-phosphate oxidase family protein [Micromonospora sp. NBC_01813]
MIDINQELSDTMDAYRTCEFATLTRDGTPIAWPTAALRRPDGTLLVTTSLAFAQKALNVRRDPRVALLFSDRTASGLPDDAPAILVQGRADCPQEIVTSPAGAEEYWAMLFARQPHSRKYLVPPARWLMGWYYTRLLITITPQHVSTAAAAPAGTGAAEASAAGTADSGAAAESGADAGPLLGTGIFDRFPSAVLAARDDAGVPVLTRVRPTAADGGWALPATDGPRIVPGPASLLVHRHDDRLDGLRNVGLRGELTETADGWLLRPQRLVDPGATGSVREAVNTLRGARRRTASYLDRRGLTAPPVRWREFQRVADSVPVP